MAEYQVIARKWRPQRFADLVGQEHVVRTLKNAIRQDRIAHAYLLVGPRGVGKTTSARIFAKALNCFQPQDGEPCCECESCRAIAEDRSIDVIEIDAASRNSADSMRELAEEARHLPVAARYKIYIIDEVHMLSKAAWNALLKTVEEPPAHVKFIFATTEAHQVLPTIVSRCQRFDLLPIPTPLIFERLKAIVETEGVRISPEALRAIARAAEGGMRDAQSLLDQMIAFFSDEGEGEIDEARVLSLFGLTAASDLDGLARALFGDDRAGVVRLVETLARGGRNLETLLEDLLTLLRGIQLSALVPEAATVLEVDDATVARYRRLGEGVAPQVVEVLLEVLAPVGRTLRDAINKTVFLETILFRAMREAHAVRIDDVLARLNQLRSAGELKFLDIAPSLAAHPSPKPSPIPPVAAVVIPPSEARSLPEKAEQRAEPKEIEKVTEPSVKSPTPPVPPIPPEPEAVPAKPEVVRSQGELLFDRLREWVQSHGKLTPEALALWDAVEVGDYRNGVLTLQVTDVAADRRRMGEALPCWQQAIQEITGNWMALVVLTPELVRVEQESAAPEVIEVAPDTPPWNESLVDAAPQDAADLEPAATTVAAATADSLEGRVAPVSPAEAPADDLTDVPSPEPTALPDPIDELPPAADDAPVEVLEESAGGESGESSEMPADGEAFEPADDRDFSKRSLIGEPGEVSAAMEDPLVQQTLDLFGGQIVDIYG